MTSLHASRESLWLDGNRLSVVIVLIKRRVGLNVAVGVEYTCVSLMQILHSSYGTL